MGLSTGPNPLTIVVMGKARVLLSEDLDDIIDLEILEKHLPVIQELQIPFVLPEESHKEYSIDPGFSISNASPLEIASLVSEANRVLVF